jgi:hypothetical protein
MDKGFSLVVEVDKGSYAVLKVSEDIFCKAKQMSTSSSSELEKILEASVAPENVLASEMNIYQAASIARGISNEFFIIDSREKISDDFYK